MRSAPALTTDALRTLGANLVAVVEENTGRRLRVEGEPAATFSRLANLETSLLG
jgi:hypothetical protein